MADIPKPRRPASRRTRPSAQGKGSSTAAGKKVKPTQPRAPSAPAPSSVTKSKAQNTPKATAKTGPKSTGSPVSHRKAPKNPPAGPISVGHAFEYDVCVSFAGEDRPFVEKVVQSLKRRRVRCFYDLDEQARLWGQDLVVLLDEVYRQKARHCVMFVSEPYTRKLWTNHERESAQARALQRNENDYILPVRLDDTEVPGLRPQRGYLDGRIHTPTEVAAMVQAKLLGKPAPARRAIGNNKSGTAPAPTPKVSRPKPAVSPDSAAVAPALSKRKITESGHWVLIGDNFYESPLVKKLQGDYHVQIAPKDSREEAALKVLEARPNWQHSQLLAFAHGDDAARCRLGEVSASSEGGKRVYTLLLHPESNASSWGGLETVLYQGLSADEMAHKRAELILLGTTASTGDTHRDQHIRMSYGGRGDEDDTKTGVVASTLRSLGGVASTHNLQKARLAAIYQLTVSRVLEYVMELTLGPASKSGIPIHLEGRRHTPYANQPATILTISGRVILSESK